MRFGRLLLIIMVIGFGSNAYAVNPGSALQIDDMPVACLADRAEKDQNAACHCPPASMCDQMPAFMAIKCCNEPESKYCPAATKAMPIVCSNGVTPDVNGNCCPYEERKYVRFKHWHIRWREDSLLSTVRFALNGVNPIPHPYTDTTVNWNRTYLPPFAFFKTAFIKGNPPTDIETGLGVTSFPKISGCDSPISAGSKTLYYNLNNCGSLGAKICPIKNESDNYLTTQYTLPYIHSQVCSITKSNGSPLDLPVHSWGGFYTTDPQSLSTKNCCIYDIPSEASCLAPDTPVLMADGTEKPIQKIVKGDVVKGQNRDNSVLDVVILTLDNRNMYSLNDGALKLTAEHPILTKDGWKSVNGDITEAKAKYGLDKVGKLQIGDEIITKDGIIKLASMEKLPLARDTTTFNLKLDGDETFHAAGIIVKDN